MSGRQRPTSFIEGSKSHAAHPNSTHACSGVDGIGALATRDKIIKVVATNGSGEGQREISFTETKAIGNGSFGVVYQARLVDQGEMIAIKKVLQDKRFKNRELQIMMKLDHINVVRLLYYFYSSGEKKDELYLNLVLEYVPETLYKVARAYSKNKQTMPHVLIKLYMYQLFRSLSHIHMLGICHRDIKPQNLLLNYETGVLKLCDFGSAKPLVRDEPNVSYICSRYYRAPELIFGATDYTSQIDIWSAGCVVAELILGQPIFPGESGVDQLVEIIKVLGTPSREQIREMNPSYQEFKFPQIKAHPWSKVFRSRTPPEALDLISQLLDYTPTRRLSPLEACAHAFFDELRDPKTKLLSGKDLPVLFNFSSAELRNKPQLASRLIPAHITATTTTTITGNGNNPIVTPLPKQNSSSSTGEIITTTANNTTTTTTNITTSTSSTAITTTTTNILNTVGDRPATMICSSSNNTTSTSSSSMMSKNHELAISHVDL